MINFEFLRLSWESIRSHKIRSALTLLGIVIGVFAIVVAVTAVKVIQTTAVNSVQSFGSTTFTISSRSEIQSEGTGRRARKNLTYHQMELLQDRVRFSAPMSPTLQTRFFVEARYREHKSELDVTNVGSNENWATNNNFDLKDGRFLNSSDVQISSPVTVIGSDLENTLFPTERAVGKDIILDGRRFKVVGVLVAKGEAFGQSADNIAVVPITRMIEIYSAAQWNINITVQAANVQAMNATMDEVITHLRVIRRVPPGAENNFEINSNESLIREISRVTDSVALAGAGIGLITLLAAGIGIMNIMLVSVTERTREIGLRKSVGARRKDILFQFLYEAIFLCQIGGLIGILLGAAGGNVVGFFTDSPVVFPWGWALLAIAGVTFIALVFGVYPAYKASGLDPIDALRHE